MSPELFNDMMITKAVRFAAGAHFDYPSPMPEEIGFTIGVSKE